MTGHGDDSEGDLREAGAEQMEAEGNEDDRGTTTRRTMIATGATPVGAAPPDAPASSEEPAPETTGDRGAADPTQEETSASTASTRARFVPQRAFAPAAPKARRERTPPAGHAMRETPGNFPNADFSLASLASEQDISGGPIIGDTGPFPQAAPSSSEMGATVSDAPDAPREDDDDLEITAPHSPVSQEESENARGTPPSDLERDAPESQQDRPLDSGPIDETAAPHDSDDDDDDSAAPGEEPSADEQAESASHDHSEPAQDTSAAARRPSNFALGLVASAVLAVSYFFFSSLSQAPVSGDTTAVAKLSPAIEKPATHKTEAAIAPEQPPDAAVTVTPPVNEGPAPMPSEQVPTPAEDEATGVEPTAVEPSAVEPSAANDYPPATALEPSVATGVPLAPATALLSSDPRRAYELATALLDGPHRQAALELQTLAACAFDDGMVARQTFRRLRGTERRVRTFDQCLNGHEITLRYSAHDYHYRELIRMSQRALDEGKFSEAYDLARTSFSQRRTPEAGVLLGKLNCALNRKVRAEVIAIKSREASRDAIVAYCATKGLTLDTTRRKN